MEQKLAENIILDVKQQPAAPLQQTSHYQEEVKEQAVNKNQIVQSNIKQQKPTPNLGYVAHQYFAVQTRIALSQHNKLLP